MCSPHGRLMRSPGEHRGGRETGNAGPRKPPLFRPVWQAFLGLLLRSGRGLRDHLAEERFASVQLTQGAELVRPMRLLDGAGTADYRRNAVILEMAGLGA